MPAEPVSPVGETAASETAAGTAAAGPAAPGPLSGLPDDGGLAADDPLLAPIDGVTFEQLVAVHAALTARPLPAGGWDEVAAGLGVPTGRWTEVDQRWRQRIFGSPALTHRFTVALDKARRALP
jgi:hypothetical protein